VDNSAHPISLPAVAGEDGLDLLPNPVAPSSAGCISSESRAAPMALGCGVTSMPDAGNPTVENVTSTHLAQDLDASTMEVVTSIPPVPNVDASAMENNGLTPNCDIAQHIVANVTSDVSVEDTTTFPSLAVSKPTSISDARDTSQWPSPIKKLRSEIDDAISMSSLGTTLSPMKDVRDLALEAVMPAALQHSNVSGDFPDSVKNSGGENDSIPAPGLLPSIKVSKENSSFTQPQTSTVASHVPMEDATSSEALAGENHTSASDTTPSRLSSVTEHSGKNLGNASRCDSSAKHLSSLDKGGLESLDHHGTSANLISIRHNGPTVAPNDDASRAEASQAAEISLDEQTSAYVTTSKIGQKRLPGLDIDTTNELLASMADHSSKSKPEPEPALNDEERVDGIDEITSMPKVNEAPTAKRTSKRKKKGKGAGKKAKKDPTWKLRQNIRIRPRESSDAMSTPASDPDEILLQNYAKYNLNPKLYYGQADLSQRPYDPSAVVLGNSGWKKNLLLNDDDLQKLPDQIYEIIKGIPENDDNKLIQHLQEDIKPAQDCNSGGQVENIFAKARRDYDKGKQHQDSSLGGKVDIMFAKARREYDKGKQHQYGKIISDIRRFSYLLVILYIYGTKKVFKLFSSNSNCVPNSK
jgi:hypothetical protein